MSIAEEQKTCIACQFCCRHIELVLEKTATPFVELLIARGIPLIELNGRWVTLFPNSCQHITEKGCSIYETRPELCRTKKVNTKDYICKIGLEKLKEKQDGKF